MASHAGHGSHLVEVDGVTHRVTRDEAGVVRAPAPAVVVAVPVASGEEVEAGETVAVLESMKMETAVRAPYAGMVRDVLAAVTPRSTPGRRCCAWTAADDEAEESTAPRVALRGGRRADGATRDGASAARGPAGAAHRLRRQRRARPAAGRGVRRRPRELPVDDPELRHGEFAAADHVRRPVRALPQPPDQRGGGGRRAGAQPARALPLLPSLARHRPRGAAGVLPGPAGPGAAALRRHRPRARPGARGGGATASSWRSSAPPTSSPSSSPCSTAG